MYCRNCGKQDTLDQHQLCFRCGLKSIVGRNFEPHTGGQLKSDEQIDYEEKVLEAEQNVNYDIARMRKHLIAISHLRSNNKVYQDAVKAIGEALKQITKEVYLLEIW